MLCDHVDQAYRGPKELVKHNLQKRPHVHLVHDRLQLDTETRQCLLELIRLLAKHVAVQLVQRLEDEVDEAAVGFGVCGLARELASFAVEPNVTLKPVRKRVHVQ